MAIDPMLSAIPTATQNIDPIPAVELSEKQREVAIIVSYDAIKLNAFKLAPYNPDAMIASKGYDELDKLKTCAAYWGAMKVKKDAVLYKPWSVKSPIEDHTDPDYDKALEIANAANWALNNIVDDGDETQDFRQVLFELLDACHYGFSTMEIEWRPIERGKYQGQWGFRRFSYKRPHAIGFQLDPISLGVRYLTNRAFMGGLPFQTNIPNEKVLRYVYCPENALPYGRGDARACYKHWWVLDTLEKIHAIALEIHGAPHYIVYAPTADSNITRVIREAVDAVRSGSNLILPETVKAELQQLASGSLDAFINAKRWHKQEIAFAVLLQELTTSQGTGVGSYALGGVHQDTQEYGLAHVRRDIESVVSKQLLRRWTRYNYGDECEHMAPYFDLGEWDANEKKLVSDFFKNLIDSKVLHPQEPQIRTRLNMAPMDKESKRMMEEDRQFEKDQATKELEIKSKAAEKPEPAPAKTSPAK